MSTPSALATAAALHILLTEQPELAALSVSWKVVPNGDLHVNPKYRAEGSHAAVRSLAAALGAEVYEYTVPDSETGEVSAVVAILGGRLAGATVHSYGYELVPVEETVLAGGAR